MYKSPIEIDYGEVVFERSDKTEENLFRCIQNISINVDKQELLKALAYDRDQYEAGYADAKSEIVHCAECDNRTEKSGVCLIWSKFGSIIPEDDCFCKHGVRRGNNVGFDF